MKFLPIAIRLILNIVFYIIYSIISLILTGFILSRIFEIMFYSDNNADKIGYVVIILVFIVTFIFKKFFYIPLKDKK